MDWKPREERSYLGTYSMGIGHPRAAYERMPTIYHSQSRFYRVEALEVGRRRARYQWTPLPGYRMPLWACTWLRVAERAVPDQLGAAARPDHREHLRGPRGRRVPRGRSAGRTRRSAGASGCPAWRARPARSPSGVLRRGGRAAAGLLAVATPLPLVAGIALGYALRERHRRRHTQRLLDLQSEEIIYSNRELEKKFARARDADRAALAADRPERGGERHARSREDLRPDARPGSCTAWRYQRAQLFLVDRARRVLRGHRMAGADPRRRALRAASSCRSTRRRARAARAAVTGQAVLVNDVDAGDDPRPPGPRARPTEVERFIATPLRVRDRVLGVLSGRPRRRRTLPPGGRGAARRGGQPGGARHRQGRELPDHRGALAQPGGQGARPHRAAPRHQRGAARRPTATCRPPSSSSSSARRWPRSASSWPASPTSSTTRSASSPPTWPRSPTSCGASGHARDLPGGRRCPRRTASGSTRGAASCRWTTRSSTSTRCSQGIREGADRTRKIVRDLRVFARTRTTCGSRSTCTRISSRA